MTRLDDAEHLDPKLREALQGRGFESLTPVQTKVLDPGIDDHDLRVTSQTGSGKTVAVGLLLRNTLRECSEGDGTRSANASAKALIVVPTRELAKQVNDELTWLYRSLGIRLACVTGGANYRDERRALGARPAVVIGTPGRLIDHIERGALAMDGVEVVVLDEADRMLDLGFTEAIEAIFAAAPNRKRTHLVSATLEPQVLRLADRYQSKPLHVEGTRYGQAHADIEHRVHLVAPAHRLGALVNLLLLSPEERTLVFARTRADVGDIAERLSEAGFRVGALSGDMEQPARDRALAAFKNGTITILVATDVAARGIDVQSMTRVIQVDPPTDPESYTHRSGRTGRAGQKGTCIVLLAPGMQRRFAALLAQARVKAKFLPLPSPAEVRATADERVLSNLAECASTDDAPERMKTLAERLLDGRDPTAVVAMLMTKLAAREPEPRDVPVIMPETGDRFGRNAMASRGRFQDGASARNRDGFHGSRGPERDEGARPKSGFPGAPFDPRPSRKREGDVRVPSTGANWDRSSSEHWGMFRITWGQLQGADARRVLAVVCRRGGIRGADVGAIRIGPTASIIEVKGAVAAEFASRALEPDPQEPRIRIHPLSEQEGAPQKRWGAAAGAPAHKHGASANRMFDGPPKKLKKYGRPTA
jgi:ATP-dependent RNA helicase DeaD